jgi:hypothetical protein
MRFKPPLTKADLHSIKERGAGEPDVAALLWEIARLRGTVLYADQLQRLLGALPGPQGQVLDALRSMLVDDPCVEEFPRLPPRVWEAPAVGYLRDVEGFAWPGAIAAGTGR